MREKSTPLLAAVIADAPLPLSRPVSDEKIGALENLSVPENVLLSARAVELAALTVMAAVPSKFTPLIARGVANWVAVPALPEILPVMRLVNVCVPAQVFDVVVPKASVSVRSAERSPPACNG